MVHTVHMLLLSFLASDEDDLGARPHGSGQIYGGVQAMKNAACGLKPPISNKFAGSGYELMYGLFLWPLRRLKKVKMLEIGLGCGMSYGPGASARTWREVLPQAELWEAELDGECVKNAGSKLDALGIHALVGDQGNRTTLRRWVAESGGQFNAIVDDGSHRNRDIMISFRVLWPTLLPGGVYFLEDLNTGRPKRWDDTEGKRIVSDILMSWQDQFLVKPFGSMPVHKSEANLYAASRRDIFPKPRDAAFIFCQDSACVIGKEPARGSPSGYVIGRDDKASTCPPGVTNNQQPSREGVALRKKLHGKDLLHKLHKVKQQTQSG